LVIGLNEYEYPAGHLPGAVLQSNSSSPTDLHGWQTLLLPHMEQQPLFDTIDLDRPYNDPVNLPSFRQQVEAFQNPGVDVLEDDDGLSLAHHSGNSQVIVSGRAPLRFVEITDGTSNTLGIGEIAAAYPPWGRPRNARDPADGLNTSPRSFGGPRKGGGTQFGMLDGKVVYLNSNIDPAVLQALASPFGGETVNLP